MLFYCTWKQSLMRLTDKNKVARFYGPRCMLFFVALFLGDSGVTRTVVHNPLSLLRSCFCGYCVRLTMWISASEVTLSWTVKSSACVVITCYTRELYGCCFAAGLYLSNANRGLKLWIVPKPLCKKAFMTSVYPWSNFWPHLGDHPLRVWVEPFDPLTNIPLSYGSSTGLQQSSSQNFVRGSRSGGGHQSSHSYDRIITGTGYRGWRGQNVS